MILNDRGIFAFDVSRWQALLDKETGIWTYIDWNVMKASGVNFVVIKCGQNNFKDFTFVYNWAEAKRLGIPRASYWFLDFRSSAKSQAELYWDFIKDDPGEGPLIVDYENGSGGDWNDVYNFIIRLQELSGYPNHRIWIYTGYYYWNEHSPLMPAQNQWFAQYPLWLAYYTTHPEYAQLPGLWDKCVLWQKGTPAIGYSVGARSAEIDYNVFNGNEFDLARYFTSINVPPPPTTGEPMYFRATTGVNIRSSAGVTPDNDLGTFNLIAGDIVEVDDVPVIIGTATWRRIRKIWRTDQAVTLAPSSTGEYWCAEKVGTSIFMVQTAYTPPITARHRVQVYIDDVLVFEQELT